MKILITFGCSWVWGAGAGYIDGMNVEDYKSIVWSEKLANEYSFRSLLAKQFGYQNINFSIWKSSNQKQFRLAQRFFSSNRFKELQKNAEEIVVLWGLTSTGRNELFSTYDNKYLNFLIGGIHPTTETEKEVSDFFGRNLYDHSHEVFELANNINHWNDYLSLLNVKNYWLDSFNHHDYTVDSPGIKEFSTNDPERVNYLNTVEVKNMAIDHEHSRDLLSQLALRYGMNEPDQKYHSSAWANDTNRLNYLISKKVLNPYSFHPTKLGHEELSTLFYPIFNKKS
jgi:hypothetical protein